MKFSAATLILGLVLAGPALAAPGDPRLIQGSLEWPPALSGGEPFIVVRGDDGHVYYADVMAAQRYGQSAVSAGGRVALLGLESTKPHEILAVALGSGDAAALSLALAQSTPNASATPSPPPSKPAPAVPATAHASEPAAVAPARPKEGAPSPGEQERLVTIRGNVYGVAGPNLFLKSDDGRTVVVDISKLDPNTARRLRPGLPTTVVAIPVGNKFQATGLIETEPGTNAATPVRPMR